MSLSQNSAGLGKGYEEGGPRPAFSAKSRVAFPKTKVLGKTLMVFDYTSIIG
jgi:hypothetical protein